MVYKLDGQIHALKYGCLPTMETCLILKNHLNDVVILAILLKIKLE